MVEANPLHFTAGGMGCQPTAANLPARSLSSHGDTGTLTNSALLTARAVFLSHPINEDVLQKEHVEKAFWLTCQAADCPALGPVQGVMQQLLEVIHQHLTSSV